MLFFVSLDPHAIKPHHRIVRGVETDDFVLHGIGFFLAHLKQHGGTQRGVSCGTGGNASFFVLHLLRVLFLFRQPHFFTERRQQLTLRPYFGSHSSFSCVPPPCKTRWYLGGRKRKEEKEGEREHEQQSVVFPFHQFNHPTDQTYRAVPSGGVTGDKTTGVSSPVPCFGVARHQTLIGVWVVGRQCFVVVQHGFTHHLRQRGRPQGFTVFSLVQRSFAHPNFRAIGVISEKPVGGEREIFFYKRSVS